MLTRICVEVARFDLRYVYACKYTFCPSVILKQRCNKSNICLSATPNLFLKSLVTMQIRWCPFNTWPSDYNRDAGESLHSLSSLCLFFHLPPPFSLPPPLIPLSLSSFSLPVFSPLPPLSALSLPIFPLPLTLAPRPITNQILVWGCPPWPDQYRENILKNIFIHIFYVYNIDNKIMKTELHTNK